MLFRNLAPFGPLIYEKWQYKSVPPWTTQEIPRSKEQSCLTSSLRSEVRFCTENGRFAFWASLWGLRATYDDHLRLTEKRVVDFLLVLIELFSLGVTAEALRANIDWRSASSLQWGQCDPKFQVDWVAPHQPFFLSQNWGKWSFMWYKNAGTTFFSFVTNHMFDRQTADRIIVARPRLHSMQRGKNVVTAQCTQNISLSAWIIDAKIVLVCRFDFLRSLSLFITNQFHRDDGAMWTNSDVFLRLASFFCSELRFYQLFYSYAYVLYIFLAFVYFYTFLWCFDS